MAQKKPPQWAVIVKGLFMRDKIKGKLQVALNHLIAIERQSFEQSHRIGLLSHTEKESDQLSIQPVFEIYEPSGKVYKIFANGQTEGFEHGSFISNGVVPLVDSLISTKNSSTYDRQKEALSLYGLASRKGMQHLSFWQKLKQLVKSKL